MHRHVFPTYDGMNAHCVIKASSFLGFEVESIVHVPEYDVAAEPNIKEKMFPEKLAVQVVVSPSICPFHMPSSDVAGAAGPVEVVLEQLKKIPERQIAARQTKEFEIRGRIRMTSLSLLVGYYVY